jgi:aminobenzoyl-glutamate utilization protein B
VRFYGTPAEEDLAGKVWMAKEGLFNDLDVCLDWHPDDQIKANMQSSQAVIDHSYIFKGRSAHAAYDPWNGRSALDAAELFTEGVNMLREHVRPSVRMHYVFTKQVMPMSFLLRLVALDSQQAYRSDRSRKTCA